MAAAESFAPRATAVVAAKSAVARFESVNKSYGKVRALADFNFDVRAGELVALLGPNGAGKTTAIRLLLGLAKPNSGRLTVFNGDPGSVEKHVRVGAMMKMERVPGTQTVRARVGVFD